MTTHSSILAWDIQWTEEPGDCGPWGHKELDTIERLSMEDLTEIGSGLILCNSNALLMVAGKWHFSSWGSER